MKIIKNENSLIAKPKLPEKIKVSKTEPVINIKPSNKQ
jgi:hypothetical protein